LRLFSHHEYSSKGLCSLNHFNCSFFFLLKFKDSGSKSGLSVNTHPSSVLTFHSKSSSLG